MAPLITFSPQTNAKSADVNANFTNLANGSAMNSPTIDSLAITNLKAASGLYDNGNSGATYTIDWTKGDRQKITISASTTLSYTGAVAGQIITLLIIENGTGNFTIALPTSKWPNGNALAFTTTPGAINTLTVMHDGTNYLTQLGQGYA